MPYIPPLMDIMAGLGAADPAMIQGGQATVGPFRRKGITSMGQPAGDIDLGPQISISDLMNQYYTPSHQASDRFNSLLDTIPQRGRPNIAQRLAASAAGPRGGPDVMDRFLYPDYRNNVQDWMTKMQPAYQAAQLENTSNANERQLAASMATATMNERKQREVERKNKSDEDIRQQRADVYRYKALNPDAKFDFSGPTVMIADPRTGQVQDTGVPTGHMTDMDKITLQNQGRVDAAHAYGSEARATEGVRQKGRETLAGMRAGQIVQDEDGNQYVLNPVNATSKPVTPATGTTKPKGPVTKIPGAGSGRTGAVNPMTDLRTKARQLSIANPNLGKWITFDNSGTPSLNPKTPPTERAQIARALGIPDSNGVGMVTQRGTDPKTGKQIQRRSSDGGKTWEYSEDGGRTWSK